MSVCVRPYKLGTLVWGIPSPHFARISNSFAAHRQCSQGDETEEAETDSEAKSEDAEDDLIGESNDELQVESSKGE